jgi:hypothetical protein
MQSRSIISTSCFSLFGNHLCQIMRHSPPKCRCRHVYLSFCAAEWLHAADHLQLAAAKWSRPPFSLEELWCILSRYALPSRIQSTIFPIINCSRSICSLILLNKARLADYIAGRQDKKPPSSSRIGSGGCIRSVVSTSKPGMEWVGS